MIRITNIAGKEINIGFGQEAGATLSAGSYRDMTDTPVIRAWAQRHAANGLISYEVLDAALDALVKIPKSVLVAVTSGVAAGTINFPGVGGLSLTLVGANATAVAADLATKVNANAVLKKAGVTASSPFAGPSSGRYVLLTVADTQDISPVSDFIALGSATGITFTAHDATADQVATRKHGGDTKTATGAVLVMNTGLKTISQFVFTVISAGKIKLANPAVEVVDGIVSFSSNADVGAVNLANGDVVHLIALGS